MRTLPDVGRAVSVTSALVRSGVLVPPSPLGAVRAGRVLAGWGIGTSGLLAAIGQRSPGRVALVDDLGPVTYGELKTLSNALARRLAADGVRSDSVVGLLARNHRGFVLSLLAVAKLGADLVLLNTGLSAEQTAAVLTRENVALVLHDAEFDAVLDRRPPRLAIWGSEAAAEELLSQLEQEDGSAVPPPGRDSRIVILTSGTTGAPKGAPRADAGPAALAGIVSRIPLRRRGITHLAAPMFHTWGFGNLALGLALESTLVLRSTFDPEDALRTCADHRCDALVAIPLMLRRILDLPVDVRRAHPVRLEVVASSGSALAGTLTTEWMDEFGDNLYNLYGSTEVAFAAVATPSELRLAPDTAGKPPAGTRLRILDPDGRPVPDGEVGRVFVGNAMLFSGYTDGGSKPVVRGLMATGDLGRIDDNGLLFVVGRADDMIVSGGENVHPQAVEEVLLRHPAVTDAAAVGVPDAEFGARLVACLVVAPGTSLTEVADWAADRLARFQRPRDYVEVARIPRNATGKVLRGRLAESLGPDGTIRP